MCSGWDMMRVGDCHIRIERRRDKRVPPSPRSWRGRDVSAPNKRDRGGTSALFFLEMGGMHAATPPDTPSLRTSSKKSNTEER